MCYQVQLGKRQSESTSSRESTLSTKSTGSLGSIGSTVSTPVRVLGFASPVKRTNLVKRSGSLYAALSTEDKARQAVRQAFALSSERLLGTAECAYSVRRIIGFGANGVVLGAVLHDRFPVAIKIIYKQRLHIAATPPDEITLLKHLRGNAMSLRYVDDWQDAHHFYLVTELFGSDWLASSSASTSTPPLPPLVFSAARKAGLPPVTVSLPFFSGSADLWAWASAYRIHVLKVSNALHSLLPVAPVKQIIHRIAAALAALHAQGFYHADIKLENILVQSVADKLEIRLADFGHARHASFGISRYGTQDLTPPEFLTGCPYAPATLDGRASDVFALGLIMRVLLNETGQLPVAVFSENMNVENLHYNDILRADMGFYPFPAIEDLDSDAQDLMNSMCMVDPAQRLNIHQVLAHPWFYDD
ncbi:hypothetical protein HK100_008293 [Physocladia obscura]|uniref:Protein kinase domain-containing protein n=1 Tax=Physocladia obscura TaxID=109957 RepID=A0AAD5SQJ2_9FUNG|nr:hypothetical protein HK100_008293 [Physocladia obscura]